MPADFKAITRTMGYFWTYLILFEIIFLINFSSVAASTQLGHLVKKREYPLPRIVSNPKSLSVMEGDTIIFPCRIDEAGKFALMWRRSKNKLLFSGTVPANNDKNFKLVNQTSLQIDSVTANYADEYTCFFNSLPPVELTHVLHVFVAPKILLDPEDGHIIVKKGDSISATCTAAGYPEPIITWRALRGTLPGGLKEIQANNLVISSADTYHSGIYVCKADNEIGNPATATVKIKVLYAPEVTITPSWVHVGVGSSVKFQCVVNAEPIATLHWIRMPDILLTEDKDITLQHMSRSSSKNVLIVKMTQLTQDKFGSYACYANNSLGLAFRVVEISGLAEPVKFRSNTSGEEEDSFLLSWSVKSYSPVIEYMLRIRRQKSKVSSSSPSAWRDVIIPVEMEQSVLHSHNYNITGLEPGTIYEVVMQARNDFGWNYPSDTFTFYTSGGDPQASAKEDITLKEEPKNVIAPGASFQSEDDKQKMPKANCSSKFTCYSLKFLLTIVLFLHKQWTIALF